MHDGVELALGEGGIECGGVAHIGVDCRHRVAGDPRETVGNAAPRVREIVEDRDVVARIDESQIRVRSDIARATCQ
jgi:sorbitol-specific phosphotransferase system component IIBC